MRKIPLVLVADDMPANVEILQMRLESRGYDCLLYTSDAADE